jgi:RND family efflux transporter MFP subunit
MSVATPSIPEPGRRIVSRVLLPVAVVASATGLLAWASWRAWAPLPAVEATAVIVRPVALQGAASDAGSASAASGAAARAASTASASGPVVQAPGWIEPAPFPVTASALVPGIVSEVLVLEGDRVDAGQVVARLVDDQFRIMLARADAELRMREAERDAMQDELTRKRKLLSSGAVSAGEVARLDLKVQGASAACDQAKAMRDDAALALERTLVRAPSAGLVMARLAAPGSFVGMDAGTAGVVQLFDPASLQVRTDVPLADAGRLAPGQRAEVQVDALPGRTVPGRIVRLVQQADIAKNTVQAKVLLEDPPEGLFPDMLARVRIRTGAASAGGPSAGGSDGSSARSEVVVPESACAGAATRDDGLRVAQIPVISDIRDGIGSVEMRAVTLAPTDDGTGWTVAIDGLRPGDLVAPSASGYAGRTVRVNAATGGNHDR